MGTKYRTSGIVQVTLRIIANLFHNLFLIFTGLIAFQAAEQPSQASCIGNHFLLVITHSRNRCFSLQNCSHVLRFRGQKGSLHFLDIRHGTAYCVHRNFQAKFIVWL